MFKILIKTVKGHAFDEVLSLYRHENVVLDRKGT